MHNKVAFRIARAFQNAGFAVLRFNFRGAGQSEGNTTAESANKQIFLLH
jgi:alpha/beta superfamily hydrolase